MYKMLTIFRTDGTKQVINLHKSFNEVIKIGKSVITPMDKAKTLSKDIAANQLDHFELA